MNLLTKCKLIVKERKNHGMVPLIQKFCFQYLGPDPVNSRHCTPLIPIPHENDGYLCEFCAVVYPCYVDPDPLPLLGEVQGVHSEPACQVRVLGNRVRKVFFFNRLDKVGNQVRRDSNRMGRDSNGMWRASIPVHTQC